MTPQAMEQMARKPSAMGYYYALELANALDIPIGLVDSSWGGTNIDAWTPRSGYDGLTDLDGERDWKLVSQKDWKAEMRKGPVGGANQQPSALWYGMVAAYTPMSIRGFIWWLRCLVINVVLFILLFFHPFHPCTSKDRSSLCLPSSLPEGGRRMGKVCSIPSKGYTQAEHIPLATLRSYGHT